MKMMNLDKLPNDLSPNEYLFLFENRNNNKIVIEYKTNDHIVSLMLFELENKKYIKLLEKEDLENGYEISFGLRQKTIDLLLKEDIIINLNEDKNEKIKIKKVSSDVSEWIEEYRDLFKGTKTGAKGDKKSCLEKMTRFFETYPEYANKDVILKATQNYINSEAVNQRYKFLQRADYFIFKKLEKEETSRLASFCDDIGEEVSNTNILDLN